MQPILALAKSAAIAGALAATAVYPLGSWGQSSSATWPKQIRIVVPFEPGASNDIFARLVGQRLAARTGSVVVVENKPGASGSIGAEYVSRAAADGSTLLATSTPFSASAAAQPKLPYDPVKGFAPVAMLASGPQILAVSADSPYRKISELIEAARANKGKLNYASTGGWNLGKEANGGAYFNRFSIVPLTAHQEALVVKVARHSFRPCCGNSTFFQDCNHGSALLGLLALGAAQGLSETELYREALAFNAFWFPNNYVHTALYFKAVRKIQWHDVDARRVMGADFSSASGWKKNVAGEWVRLGLLPAQGGADCDV
ncbi:MAG: hypothetical protein HYU75_22980 [Betaproteobacteria bacterium]|nr:hypothetical protein [Betaproteobacteria bacterium]